jgi:hypothetical protein
MAKYIFTRYGLSGVVFTLLGPGILWLAYPVGPLLALGIAEVSCHVLRYLSFRHFDFPIVHGFHVSLPRYIAAIPTTLANVLLVVIFRNLVGRTSLTILIALFSVSVGSLWSRFVYKQRRNTRTNFY